MKKFIHELIRHLSTDSAGKTLYFKYAIYICAYIYVKYLIKLDLTRSSKFRVEIPQYY